LSRYSIVSLLKEGLHRFCSEVCRSGRFGVFLVVAFLFFFWLGAVFRLVNWVGGCVFVSRSFMVFVFFFVGVCSGLLQHCKCIFGLVFLYLHICSLGLGLV
jgi:hypothetical protein